MVYFKKFGLFSLLLLIFSFTSIKCTKYLVSASRNGEIKIWENLDRCIKTIQVISRRRIPLVTFHPTNENIIVYTSFENQSSRYMTITMYNFLENRYIKKINAQSNDINALTFHPTKHNLIVTASCDGIIRIQNIKTRHTKVLVGHQERVNDIAFPINSTNENIIASCSEDNSIKIWNMQTGTCIKTVADTQNPNDSILSIAFNPENENIIVSTSATGQVKTWDINRDILLESLAADEWTSDSMRSVKFHPTLANIFATASDNKNITIWRIPNKHPQVLRVLKGHGARIYSIIFHPIYEHILVSSSFDKTIKVWDWKRKKLLNDLKGHRDAIGSLSFSPTYEDSFEQEDENERIDFLTHFITENDQNVASNLGQVDIRQTDSITQLFSLKSLLIQL